MKIGFIGCGNMGGALACAVADSGIFDMQLFLADTDCEKANALAEKIGATVVQGAKIAEECNIIFLGVKPAVVEKALSLLKAVLSSRNDCVIITMAAGVKAEKIAELSGNKAVIRIMPNTPVKVGEGVVLYTVTDAAQKYKNDFLAALTAAGSCVEITESLIDAGCAVSGCGPAFVYMFIEALADGGVNCGLSRNDSLLLAAKTVMGAAKTVLETGEHPEKLKDDVCSPAGSTIAGVAALEKGAFRGTVGECVMKAYEKTKQLG